ncbi:MAG TPA: hypothetical protein VGR02_21650 [Thermoanaerobaculia bacterium]|jgi:hypothetical protein|nr:hypothetical protein [Thermoanaerobaculia bacterium]
MRTRLLPSLFLIAIAAACSSSSNSADRPAGLARPEIGVRSTAASIFFGSGATAPVPLEVIVANNASVPLRVRRIQIESPGMAEYSLYPVTRMFNEEVGPGQTKTFNIVATAYTNISRLNPTEPLQVRATVEFEGPDQHRFREIVFQRTT